MSVAAILVAGPKPRWCGTPVEHSASSLETATGVPLACLDVLGASVLARTIERLQYAGVKAISVITPSRVPCSALKASLPAVSIRQGSEADDLWGLADEATQYYVQQHVGEIALLRLGAYSEFNLADLVRFHRDKHQSATWVSDDQNLLDFWLIRAKRASEHPRTSITELFEQQAGAMPYILSGYVNRLANAQDLRRLAVDGFLSRCAVHPRGQEVTPGVWCADGAKAHRRARIVAPAYLGVQTRVGADALITRSSTLERGCIVDHGTAVEDTSALPNTYLGRGLNVTHSIVSGNKLIHLRHNVMVEINDGYLGRTVASQASGSQKRKVPEVNLMERILATAWSQIIS